MSSFSLDSPAAIPVPSPGVTREHKHILMIVTIGAILAAASYLLVWGMQLWADHRFTEFGPTIIR